MAKKKKASDKKKAAKKVKKKVARKVKAKKKAAPKTGGRKKTAKKTRGKAKTASKKTKKAAKKAKKKPGKAAKKPKKVSKKAGKAVKKIKKTAKKTSQVKSGKKTVSKKKAAKPAKPKKIKFSVNIARKRAAPKVAPGVLIEKEPPQKSVDKVTIKQEERKLTAKELRQIRDKLISKRETILAELRHQRDDSLARSSEPKADALDRAADVLDGNVSYEVALAGQQELEEIEIALQKIDNHTYGRCESCESYIGSARLKVLPSATLCANCRKLKENNGDSTSTDTIWGFPADSEK